MKNPLKWIKDWYKERTQEEDEYRYVLVPLLSGKYRIEKQRRIGKGWIWAGTVEWDVSEGAANEIIKQLTRKTLIYNQKGELING